jgi:hypothetical protein
MKTLLCAVGTNMSPESLKKVQHKKWPEVKIHVFLTKHLRYRVKVFYKRKFYAIFQEKIRATT